MKKRLLLFISLVFTMIFGAFTLVGCKLFEDKIDVQHQTPYLQINKKEMSLLIGETETLSLNYAYGESAPKFRSLNADIAVVDDYGVVEAVSVGETTIEATYGGLKDTCVVSVGLYGQLPAIQTTQICAPTVNVLKGDQVNFHSVVLFNGREYWQWR